MRGRVIDAQGGGGDGREQGPRGRRPPGELGRLRGETGPLLSASRPAAG